MYCFMILCCEYRLFILSLKFLQPSWNKVIDIWAACLRNYVTQNATVFTLDQPWMQGDYFLTALECCNYIPYSTLYKIECSRSPFLF
jgi:hypothetical protein